MIHLHRYSPYLAKAVGYSDEKRNHPDDWVPVVEQPVRKCRCGKMQMQSLAGWWGEAEIETWVRAERNQ